MAEQLDPRQLEEARKLAQELNIAFNGNVRSAQELELTIKGMRARLNEINTELFNNYDYFRKITEQLKNTNVATNDLKKSYSNLTSAAQTIQQVQLGNQTLSLEEISNLRDKITLNEGIADAALETYKRDENALISKIANEKRISTEQAKAAFEAQKTLTTNIIQQEELNSFLNEQNNLSNQNFISLDANLQQQEKLKEKLNNQKNISGAVVADYKSKLTILQNEATILENNQKLFDDENNMIESSLKDLQSQEVSLNSQINLLGEHKNKLNDLAKLRQEQEDRAQNLNEETQVLLNYLKKEETYQNNINKSMGITGALASGLETTLNKMGLSKLSQQLGIGDALTKTKEFAQQITAGSNGVTTMSQKFQITGNLIKNIGSSLIKNLTDPITITTFLVSKLVDLFKFLINSGLAFSERTAEIARNFAISTKDATLVNEELSRMVSNSNNLLATQNNLKDALLQINEQFGTSALLTQNTLEGQIDLTKKLKLNNEESSIITSFALQQGTSQQDIVSSITKQNSGIINNKKVIQEVAKVQGQLYAQYKGSPELIAKAVVQTQKLGITLQQAQQISKGLLEFETSIGAELEAELLTGKQLNLEQARYKALMGDSAGAAAEVLNQVGGIEEFSRLNVIQQAALAKSIGLSADELANSLRTQQILTNLGAENVKAYDEAIKAAEKAGDYDKARALEELKNKGKKFDMAQQELGAQEKFNAAVDKLKALLISIVEGPMGKMADKLVSMVELIAKIPGIGNIIGIIAGLGGATIAAGLAASVVKGATPLTAMWVRQTGVPGIPGGPVGSPGGPGGRVMSMVKSPAGKLSIASIVTTLGAAALNTYSSSKKEEAELLKSQGKAEEAKKAQTTGKTAAVGSAGLEGLGVGLGVAGALTMAGVGLSATGIGAIIGIPLLAAAGIAAYNEFGGDEEETETPMAKGGIITKPTKVLAGEAGVEAIIPLSRNSLIDINPIVVAINELGKSQEKLISSINNKPIMIENKVELDGQQVAYNQSTGAQSYRT